MKHDYTQSDRYVKIDRPVALPGCCFFCRKADAEFYVDLKMQSEHPVGIAMDGAVYMCSECIDFIARITGYTKLEQIIIDENKDLDSKLYVATRQIEALTKVTHELLDSGFSVPDGMAEHVASVLQIVETKPAVESESDSTVDESEPGASESSDDEGVGELRPSKSGKLAFNLA